MFTVSGHVHFSGKMKGERADIEPTCQDMLADIATYAQEKYPGFVWDASPISLWTKVSKLVKNNGARRSSD
jgi:hypothetical protein